MKKAASQAQVLEKARVEKEKQVRRRLCAAHFRKEQGPPAAAVGAGRRER